MHCTIHSNQHHMRWRDCLRLPIFPVNLSQIQQRLFKSNQLYLVLKRTVSQTIRFLLNSIEIIYIFFFRVWKRSFGQIRIINCVNTENSKQSNFIEIFSTSLSTSASYEECGLYFHPIGSAPGLFHQFNRFDCGIVQNYKYQFSVAKLYKCKFKYVSKTQTVSNYPFRNLPCPS